MTKIAKATKCQPVSVSANRSSSRTQRRQRAAQAFLRSPTHRRGSRPKPARTSRRRPGKPRASSETAAGRLPS